MPAFPIEPGRRPQVKNLTGDESLMTQTEGTFEYAVTKWHSFAYECSVFGVRQSMDIERHWLVRIVWGLLVLTGIGLAAYQIEARIAYYVSYPTSTDVNVKLASIVRFPQVTICNENKYRKSVAKKLGIDTVLLDMFPLYNLPNLRPKPNLTILEDLNYTQQQWDELRIQLGQPQDVMLPFGVTWSGETLDASTITPLETDMGLCYTFNAAGSNFETIQPGASFGLQLIMDADQDDYLVTNSGSAGFRMLIHDPQEQPIMLQSAFFVTPGVTTSIAFTFENISSLGTPYSQCNIDVNYRQSNCQQECLRQYVVQQCTCKMSYMLGVDRNCTILEEYTCALPSIRTCYNSSSIMDACICPDECYSHVYQQTISQAVLSKDFQQLILERFGINGTSLVQNFVTFQMFPPTLKYTDVSATAAYNIMALLSDIGGALALMLGATLLTFWELAEFFHQLIKNMLIIHRQGQKKEVVQNTNFSSFQSDNWSLADRWNASSRSGLQANNGESNKTSVQEDPH